MAGENLGQRGKEFGTVTARKEDADGLTEFLVRQTIKISVLTG